MTTRYVPHVLYTIAITSLSTHLLSHRKHAEEQRLHTDARIALLTSIADRLRARQHVPPEDYLRMHNLAKVPGEADRAAARGVAVDPGVSMRWTEVLLGRKDAEGGQEVSEARRRSDEWEKRDLEQAQREIQSAEAS